MFVDLSNLLHVNSIQCKEYVDVTGKRSELLSGDTVVLKEKIDDTNEIFENGRGFFKFVSFVVHCFRTFCKGDNILQIILTLDSVYNLK